MKKLIILIIALMAGSLINAQDVKKDQKPMDDWTCFQIGFWFDVPSSTANSNVYGLKTGQPISSGHGRVYGPEISWFVAGTDYIKGGQASFIFCKSITQDGVQAAFGVCINQENLSGLQATLIASMNRGALDGVQCSAGLCMTEKELNGLQAGVVNLSDNLNGFQASAVNVTGDVSGVQCGFVNCTKDFSGCQLSLVNISKKVSGLQASVYNQSEESKALQLGVINIARKTGFQFGLVNVIKDGWLPFCPLINFSF